MFMVQDQVLNSWQLDESQRNALYRLRGANEKFKHVWGESTDWDAAQATTLAVAAHGESGLYLTGWDLLIKELDSVKQCDAIIADEAALDYTTLALPAALAKYPPVRRIDLRAKSGETRPLAALATRSARERSPQQQHHLDTTPNHGPLATAMTRIQNGHERKFMRRYRPPARRSTTRVTPSVSFASCRARSSLRRSAAGK